MKRIVQWGSGVVVCVLPVLSIFVAVCGAGELPETITLDRLRHLYEPVVFDHAMHMENYECSSCHHHTTGGGTTNPLCSGCHQNSGPAEHVQCSECHVDPGHHNSQQEPQATHNYHIDKPGLKGALHLQCAGCHASEGGPVGCRACHQFTSVGRNRFRIPETE